MPLFSFIPDIGPVCVNNSSDNQIMLKAVTINHPNQELINQMRTVYLQIADYGR